MSANEGIKTKSNYLRGTLLESLANGLTGSVSKDDTQLTKFHGIYQQDDRDIRAERRKKKLEPAYSFMIRVRVPGGVSTVEQWLEMDRIAREHANGTLKLTTRQAFQFHGVIKSNLKTTIREINDSLLDTIAACGDVNRNVMCNPNPDQSRVHGAAQKLAQDISDHLTPRTSAYHEIWLTDGDGEKHKVTKDPEEEVEPIYGKTYLPRKFKTVVAVPPSNDVDIFAHCLGYIAIVENDEIVGYNVTVGGGMGMTHGDKKTFPRLADVMAFCTPEQAVEVAEAVVRVQKEYGNRKERKNARLKYTVENFGLKWFRNAVEERLGYKLEDPRPYHFEHNGDRYGWTQDHHGLWHYTLFIENGRLFDTAENPALTGLREIAKTHNGDFRLTANQNLIISRIEESNKEAIQALLDQYGLDGGQNRTALRRNSMACVALPTCGLSLAESERYLPKLVTGLDDVIEEAGLREDEIVIRMTGCPNGCGRPYLGEIGFVGTNANTYNLYLGAGFAGERLNKLYRRDVKDREIVSILRPIIHDYAQNREEGERFGDFTIRAGYVHATTAGNNFHDNIIEREPEPEPALA
ncbi:MAG: NADPH-dependent assimilatory sulfite reductase hemoprotein subunit [Verrucomicrobiota bacterium]